MTTVQQITKLIEDAYQIDDMKTIAKQETAAVKKEQRKQLIQNTKDTALKNIIEQNDYVYIQTQNKIRSKEHWLSLESLKNTHTILQDRDMWITFLETMNEMGRVYKYITCSFTNKDPEAYNTLSKDNWLKPDTSKEPHELFSILLSSLGGGKKENIEHIEQVIACKYMHPENFLLPCMIFFPEGATGKGLLVTGILNKVFGGAVYSGKSKEVFGEHNGHLEGKVVILLNEAIRSNAQLEDLNDRFQSPTFTINDKFVKQYTTDNTALYMIASNDLSGPVKIKNDGSERRFSPIMSEPGYNLAVAISRAFNIEVPTNLKPFTDILTDNQEISYWLGYLTTKYQNITHVPPLRGQDFSKIVDHQKDEKVILMEQTFVESREYVKFNDLWLRYKQIIETENPGQRHFIKKSLFKTFVLDWIARNKPQYEWKGQASNNLGKIKIDKYKSTTFEGFGLKSKQTFSQDNFFDSEFNNVITFKEKTNENV